jgi:hypothetical protein
MFSKLSDIQRFQPRVPVYFLGPIADASPVIGVGQAAESGPADRAVRFPLRVLPVTYFSGLLGAWSGEKITGQMKENRSGKAERIDPVHDAAMAGNDGSVVFHAPITLDGRHHQAAIEPHQGNGQSH